MTATSVADAGQRGGSTRRVVDQGHLAEHTARTYALENLSEGDDVDGAAAHDVHGGSAVLLEEDALTRIEVLRGNAASCQHAEIEFGIGHCPQCLVV